MREDVIPIILGLPEFRVLWVEESDALIEVWVEKVTPAEACPSCGYFSTQDYDERWDDVWDRPLWDKGVRLWVRKRRFSCLHQWCSYYQQDKPFAQPYASLGVNQRRTYRFERYIYRLAKRMAHTEVVKELAACHTPISDNTVGRIYHRLAQTELAGYEPGRVVAIGIDEYSVWRGHRYATIITDLIRHRVIETFLGRDKDTVVSHLQALFPPGQIKLAVLDLNGSYETALLTALPGVKIIIDKFHVVAVVMDALDATRKRVQRERTQPQGRRIFKLRKLLRKAREELDDEGQSQLEAIFAQEADLQTAYQLKEDFRAWYRLTIPELATAKLSEWYQQVEASQLPEWQTVPETLRSRETQILN
ncbi:MAG: ISL3 family transposase [Pseudomonadota bacterium]